MERNANIPYVAIACGGTGGHLFPGIAVGDALMMMGADVALIVSEKEVDQHAVKSARGMEVLAAPAVASTASKISFARGLLSSIQHSRAFFKKRRPDAVLAMGGFTSAGPIVAGRLAGAPVFLHEANSIPGRANRWLAPLAREVFVAFEGAAERLKNRRVNTVGMPVRPELLGEADAGAARMALGLDPDGDVLLIMGGSQGASAINEAALASAAALAKARTGLQFIHLTGTKDFESCKAAWAKTGARAVVFPFLTEMELALNAATVAISRAGASSLAEFAALKLPAILVPYPAAADDHQLFNARAFAGTGAARIILQRDLCSEHLVAVVLEMIENEARRERIVAALAKWHAPDCARQIAAKILGEAAPGYKAPETHFALAI